jgi:transport family protein 27
MAAVEAEEGKAPEKYVHAIPEPMESAVRSMETTHRTILMLRCKVVVVGDATVGKSALISMFHSGGQTYPKQYVMTSWVDFRVKQVDIPDTSTAVELYLFDCAGDPVFNQVEENSVQYDQAGFVFVVYDVTREDSFSSCAKWVQGVRKGREDGQRLPGVLVANKVDLEERRVVTSERGREFARENGLAYFETSALQGTHEAPFVHVASEFAKKYEETITRAEDN